MALLASPLASNDVLMIYPVPTTRHVVLLLLAWGAWSCPVAAQTSKDFELAPINYHNQSTTNRISTQQRLIDLGKLDRERLRARYSLRLQKKGLRCTDISRFELLLPAADSVRLSAADLPTETTEEGELHPLLARQQLQEQLDEANGYVRRFINRLLVVYVIGCVAIFGSTLASRTTIDALAYVMAFLVAMFFVRLVVSPVSYTHLTLPTNREV